MLACIFQIVKPQIIIENGIKNDVGALSDADLNSLDPLGEYLRTYIWN